MSSFASEIVVGIDFGTTHSGVSWAVNGGTKKVRVISNWPDPKAGSAQRPKVPSSISYVNGKPKDWGYEVDTKDEYFNWYKILLKPDHHYRQTVEEVRRADRLLNAMGKSAQDVVADYLRFLWQYTLQDIRETRTDYTADVFEIRVVLTVPAIWDDAAKNRTLQAAKAADMPQNIMLVTEPEAAALATLRQSNDELMLRVGDAFVLCDAGGGTVDLISYQVTKLRPLEIKECAIGDGDLCGSIFLDDAFMKHIITLVGKDQWETIKARSKVSMMRDWEYSVKRNFTEDTEKSFSLELHGVVDDRKNGIVDELITIDKSSLRAVFEHIASQIETLVARQITAVRRQRLPVKAVLLVGGFGESRFLLQYLSDCHRHDSIVVNRVDEAWSSICRGATLYGLEHSKHTEILMDPSAPKATVASRLARYSYGVCVSRKFDERVHLAQDKFFSEARGEWMARNQMSWLLRRGEEIENGKVLTTTVFNHLEGITIWSKHHPERFATDLYSCADEAPPSRLERNVKQLCAVHYTINTKRIKHNEKSFKQSGKTFRTCTFCFELIPNSATLDFVVKYHDEVVGEVEAKYMDSST